MSKLKPRPSPFFASIMVRKVREITPEEEGFRLEPFAPGMAFIKVNSVEPEPVGTIVLLPFRITGYDKDCDGSLMIRAENLYLSRGEIGPSGWDIDHVSISPNNALVVSDDELVKLLSDEPQEANEIHTMLDHAKEAARLRKHLVNIHRQIENMIDGRYDLEAMLGLLGNVQEDVDAALKEGEP